MQLTGPGGEYFLIGIVNIALKLATPLYIL